MNMLVERGRGNGNAVLREHGTHRLDTPDKAIRAYPKPLVGADEPNNYWCGRSSSAAKKVEAALNMKLVI